MKCLSNNVMNLSLVDINWRILYLIYVNKQISTTTLKTNFKDSEISLMESELSNFIGNGTVKSDPPDVLSIKSTETDPFLRIFSFVYNSEIPMTRTEIRGRVKHKLLNEIINQLINADILIDYRSDISKHTYVFSAEHKDIMIAKIRTLTEKHLTDLNTTDSNSQLIMVQRGFDIRSSFGDIDSIKIQGKNEIILTIALYRDYVNKVRNGNESTSSYITQSIFNGRQLIADKTIKSLISKGIIKCSPKLSYYINNSILPQIKAFYDIHKQNIK